MLPSRIQDPVVVKGIFKLDKIKISFNVQGHLSNRERRNKMDIFVIVIAGLVAAIASALVAIIKKKDIGKIFVYALLGFVIGLPFGYVLAPFIISFY